MRSLQINRRPHTQRFWSALLWEASESLAGKEPFPCRRATDADPRVGSGALGWSAGVWMMGLRAGTCQLFWMWILSPRDTLVSLILREI